MVQCAVYVIMGSHTPTVLNFPLLPAVGQHVRLDGSADHYEVRRVVINAEGIPQLQMEAPIELWVRKADAPPS